jgi:hypothetical protein
VLAKVIEYHSVKLVLLDNESMYKVDYSNTTFLSGKAFYQFEILLCAYSDLLWPICICSMWCIFLKLTIGVPESSLSFSVFRSWILAEEDSTTDVDTDSDFNETSSSSSSSCSSPVGAGRQKKRLPLSSYYNFGAAARRRRWRKTLPAKPLSRELSTSCSSFLFEGDFGDGNKASSKGAQQQNADRQQRTPVSSDSDDLLSPPSSGNGNRSARLLPVSVPLAGHAGQASMSAMNTPVKSRNPFWRHMNVNEERITEPENNTEVDGRRTTDDLIGYNSLLSSMEALMAKFGELASSPSRNKVGHSSCYS